MGDPKAGGKGSLHKKSFICVGVGAIYDGGGRRDRDPYTKSRAASWGGQLGKGFGEGSR